VPLIHHLYQDILILALEKKMTISEGSEELAAAVQEGLGKGIRKILFDLSAVESLDNRGVGQIMECLGSIQNQGGRLILCGLRPEINLVLQKAGVHHLLYIQDGTPGEGLWN
jgi:anti-anti-sigma factor